MNAPAALSDLRDLEAGAAYPGYVLEGCETALILYAAAFHGKQDAVWIAEAGLQATCVDLDGEKLLEMEAVYPDDWEFVRAEVFEWANPDMSPVRYDVVSLDPWTQDFVKVANRVETWCRLANRAVVLGCGAETPVTVPDGWALSDWRKRSDYDGGVYWCVLERV